MAKRAAKNRLLFDLTEITEKFEKIKSLAQSSEESEEQVEELRCQTLDQMFVFGQQLRAEPEKMAAYFTAQGVKVNKVTRDNPYNALVPLAFNKLKKAARSQYARTLAYAHATRINTPVGDWLREKGIAARYGEAVTHFSDPYKKFRGSARHLQIEQGKQVLGSKAISPKFELPEQNDAGAYRKALLRVDSTGKQAQIVTLLDTSDADLDKIFHSFGTAADAAYQALSGRSLFPLFRALHLVCQLMPSALKGAQLVVRNIDQNGSPKTVIESASEAHSFPWARMTLAYAIECFDGTGAFSISLNDAKRFVEEFQSTTEWSWADDGNLALAADKHEPITFRPLSATMLRIGGELGRRTKPFWLTAEAMDACSGLFVQLDKAYAKGPHHATKRASTRLELQRNKGVLAAVPVGATYFSVPLLTMKKAQGVADNRWLAGSDIAAVCKALRPYNVDVSGAFRDTDVEDAAIHIMHDFGADQLEICVPMTVSAGMDKADVCVDLKFPELGEPGVGHVGVGKFKKKAA